MCIIDFSLFNKKHIFFKLKVWLMMVNSWKYLLRSCWC